MRLFGILGKKVDSNANSGANQVLDDNMLNDEDPLNGLYNIDSGFSRESFKDFVISKLYEIIGFINNKDSLSIAKIERDRTQRLAQKIEQYAAGGFALHVGGIDVRLCNPLFFNADEEHEILDYYIEACLYAYLTDIAGNYPTDP